MSVVDIKLLQKLQENNLLSEEQIKQIKMQVGQTGKSEVALILENGMVREEDLFKTRADQYNIPFIDVNEISPPADALSQISIDKIKEQRVIPFEMTEQEMKVVMADPFDVHALQTWKMKFAPRKITVYAGIPSQIQQYIDTRLGTQAISSEVHDALSQVEDSGQDVKQVAIDIQDALDNASLSGAPIAKIVNSILVYATKFGASDIHIEPLEREVRVRYRIDGVMKEKLTLPKQVQSAIVARVKIMADLRIDETRLPQDGRIYITVGEKKFDLRVSILPSVYGEKVVMRLLERSSGVPPLEHSGLRGVALKNYLDAIRNTNGIILVTGPTGSGKTRTLASTLQIVSKPNVNVVTAEDPVEIRLPGVTQVQVRADIGLTFAYVLRSMLRQDPDIIMVGEIRDQETAQLAVRAALTGHLVLSTLHTNSAPAALARMVDMGVEPYLLASTIRAVVGQRLVRTICMACRQPYVAEDAMVNQISSVLGGIQGFDIYKYVDALSKRQNTNTDTSSIEYLLAPPVEPVVDAGNGNKQIKLYKGAECPNCGNTGYKGRIGIFEVMIMTDTISDMLMKGRPTEEIAKQAVADGMITMLQDGYLKAIEGITTVEEVLRVAQT